MASIRLAAVSVGAAVSVTRPDGVLALVDSGTENGLFKSGTVKNIV